jgi:ribosomal protein S18 acetylase RimI-like enzyme/acyl carrier protein
MEASVFTLAAARAGLFPDEKYFQKFPLQLPYTRITLSYFKSQPYKIRTPEKRDLKELYQIEEICWPKNLRHTKSIIRSRIFKNPFSHLVIEMEGKIVGALYSQPVASIEQLRHIKFEDIDSLRIPESKIVQLLNLNIHPDYRQLSVGSHLLKFFMLQLRLKGNAEQLIGVSRCRDFKKQTKQDYDSYVFEKDPEGYPVDSILKFHAVHGAEIRSVLYDYRVRDHENNHNGVLINYDLKGPVSSVATDEITRPKEEISQRKSIGDVSGDIEKMIKSFLKSKESYDPSHPLMEMGMDSVDLMELGALVMATYKIELPSFFLFVLNNPNRLIEKLF